MTYSYENTYPLDTFGAKLMGFDDWLNNYFMPISGQEYAHIYQTVRKAYIEAFCTNQEPAIYWTSVASLKLVHHVTKLLFELLRLRKLQALNYTHVASQTVRSINEYQQILINTPISFFSEYSEEIDTNKQKIKTFYSILQTAISPKQHGLCLGSETKEMAFYAQNNNLFLHRIYPQAFLTPYILTIYQTNYLELTQKFVSTLQTEFPNLMPHILTKIETDVSESLSLAHNHLYKLYRLIRYLPNFRLLATRLNNYAHRILIAACRMAQKSVLGFPHGNTFASCYDTIHIDADGLSVLSHIQASSPGQATLLKQLINDCNEGLHLSNVLRPTQSLYQNTYSQLQQESRPSNIQTVLLVGFPPTDHYYPSFPSCHAFSMLHLEVSLVQTLKELGYRVIYKAHPDSLQHTSGLFDNISDQVVTDPFETAYRQADCILFSYSRTSTFGYALMTNKPIVLINTDDIMWANETRPLLNQRLRFLPASVDDNGHIIFDTQDLKHAFNTALEFNHQVISTFAL